MQESKTNEHSLPSPSRRNFFKQLAAGAAAASMTGAALNFAGAEAVASDAAGAKGVFAKSKRRARAFAARTRNAKNNILKKPLIDFPVNGDESAIPDFLNQYTKGLQHQADGRVVTSSYNAFVSALNSGSFTQIEALTLGCPNPANQRKLVNPLSGIAFDGQGLDSFQCPFPAPPAMSSAWHASELVELYWMALLRDVHFGDYSSNSTAIAAAGELSTMTDFRAPKVSGTVTAQTLFRDPFPGCTTGPYVSQFLLKSVPYGSQIIDARQRSFAPGVDFIKSFSIYKDILDGCKPTESLTLDSTLRYIRNGRDLAAWVRSDVVYQGLFNAALALLAPVNPSDALTGGGYGAPLRANNPYKTAAKQDGFVTFGPVNLFSLLAEVASRAMKAAWHQKWFVHRRARPEESAGHLRQVKQGNLTFNLNNDLLNSAAVASVFAATGDYLLPQAYPEGSPLHPSYPSGHAVIAGSCGTILKAFYDENFVITNPKIASADGLTLVNYAGGDAGQMTVGGEINKLMSNIATGRNIAGIHWRTDAEEGVRLGEEIALSILAEQKELYPEEFPGFTLTRIDGTVVNI